jgi:FtsP/CotA-like multicopper oxidase with cupredoxin domain
VGIAAVVEGKFNQADAEVIDHSPSVLTGNHFDLTIEPHHVDLKGRRTKAIKINGSLPGPTLKWREGETVFQHRVLPSLHTCPSSRIHAPRAPSNQ